MSALLIEHARCATEELDPTAQRQCLERLGVAPERTYVDHGLTGSNRERPGLRETDGSQLRAYAVGFGHRSGPR